MAKFVEVMRHYLRMCKAKRTCTECGLFPEKGDSCAAFVIHNPGRAEELIMGWAADHPEKTMRDVFFEAFPNAPRDEVGNPRLCPLDVGLPARPDGAGYDGECHTEASCAGCWNRPAPEEVAK